MLRKYDRIFQKYLPLSFWSKGYERDPSISTSIRVAPYFKKISSHQWPNNKVPNDTMAYSFCKKLHSNKKIYKGKKRTKEVNGPKVFWFNFWSI